MTYTKFAIIQIWNNTIKKENGYDMDWISNSFICFHVSIICVHSLHLFKFKKKSYKFIFGTLSCTRIYPIFHEINIENHAPNENHYIL